MRGDHPRRWSTLDGLELGVPTTVCPAGWLDFCMRPSTSSSDAISTRSRQTAGVGGRAWSTRHVGLRRRCCCCWEEVDKMFQRFRSLIDDVVEVTKETGRLSVLSLVRILTTSFGKKLLAVWSQCLIVFGPISRFLFFRYLTVTSVTVIYHTYNTFWLCFFGGNWFLLTFNCADIFIDVTFSLIWRQTIVHQGNQLEHKMSTDITAVVRLCLLCGLRCRLQVWTDKCLIVIRSTKSKSASLIQLFVEWKCTK